MSALPNVVVSVIVSSLAAAVWIYADTVTRLKTAERAKRNREARKARGACIDEPDRGPAHGEVWRGGRCETCWRKSR